MADNAPLAITIGEPAGVGPDLIARLWRQRKDLDLPAFLVTGAAEAFRPYDPDLPVRELDSPAAAGPVFEEALPLLRVGTLPTPVPGVLQEGSQAVTIAAIDRAVELARRGAVSGVVTAPVQKSHLMKVGFAAPGHTDYLATLCDLPASASVMMLATEGLRVVPITAHIPISDVAKALTLDTIVHTAIAVHRDLRSRFGISRPRLSLAGLNPHAGEGGLIGIEEATHLTPALFVLREDYGIDITGPHPADTLFHAEARKQYDAVLCPYHDQALIPIKTLDFWGAVNITLGLPIIRTSPDHGTALDLAGSGRARMDSFLNAVRVAGQMSDQARRVQDHDH